MALSPSSGNGSGIRWIPSATFQAPSLLQCSPESGETAKAVGVLEVVTDRTLRCDVGEPEVEGGLLDATVDLEQLAGDVLPGLRREVEDARGNVLRLADPAERGLALELPHQLGLARDELQRAGEDRPDVDAVDADARRQVLGGHLGPVREGGLGRAVGDEPAVRRTPHHRADRDDALLLPVVVLQHQRHGGLGERVGRGHVEAERLVEEAVAGLHELPRERAADVVDHGVEPAELVVRRLRQAADGVEVAEVGGDHQAAAPGRADLLRDHLELLGGACGNEHVGAGLGERDGGGGAEAAARAGDDGDLVGDRETVDDAHLLTSPRPVISGRSSAVTRPPGAATTAGTAFTIRWAVVIMPETLWSPCSPWWVRSSCM